MRHTIYLRHKKGQVWRALGLWLEMECESSLEAFNPCHIGKMVSNSFMAIDTGFLTAGQGCRVHLGGAWRLSGKVHIGKVMAVTALKRVVCL